MMNFIFFICYAFYSAVLEVGDGVFEVLSTSGDTHLGGDDFDKVGTRQMDKLVAYICCFLRDCY